MLLILHPSRLLVKYMLLAFFSCNHGTYIEHLTLRDRRNRVTICQCMHDAKVSANCTNGSTHITHHVDAVSYGVTYTVWTHGYAAFRECLIIYESFVCYAWAACSLVECIPWIQTNKQMKISITHQFILLPVKMRYISTGIWLPDITFSRYYQYLPMGSLAHLPWTYIGTRKAWRRRRRNTEGEKYDLYRNLELDRAKEYWVDFLQRGQSWPRLVRKWRISWLL